jgi:tRNA(Ile)-lysidine synthase
LREGEVRRVEFAESIFEIERVAGRTEDLMETDAAVFDAGGLDPPLHVRGWRQGDGFVPFGMKGRKKVSDLLNEQAIPVAQRASVAIVEDRRSILWVVGLRRSNRAPITERTGAYIRIRTRRAPESS